MRETERTSQRDARERERERERCERERDERVSERDASCVREMRARER